MLEILTVFLGYYYNVLMDIPLTYVAGVIVVAAFIWLRYKLSVAFFKEVGTAVPKPEEQSGEQEDGQDDTDKLLRTKLKEKRSKYKCGDEFVTLTDIPTWKDYFKINQLLPAIIIPGEKQYAVSNTLNCKVSLWPGDITAMEIDSIVNAANSSLLGGSGVDGAIHQAAGSKLVEECRALNGCPTGKAKMTSGYKLPAEYVIHTVGPKGEKPGMLRSCYLESFQLMLENKLRSIAFPCISTGVYGYPRVQAAKVALETVRNFLENNSDKVDRVIFTIFLKEDLKVYEELMPKYFPLQ